MDKKLFGQPLLVLFFSETEAEKQKQNRIVKNRREYKAAEMCKIDFLISFSSFGGNAVKRKALCEAYFYRNADDADNADLRGFFLERKEAKTRSRKVLFFKK